MLVYDHHAEAGSGPLDNEARRRNFVQLAAHIQAHAAGRAVIVTGDTNLDGFDEPDATFLAATGLVDACRALSCPTDTIDRVMFRGSEALELTPTSWRFADEMVDAAGGPLSDHDAVSVAIGWRAR